MCKYHSFRGYFYRVFPCVSNDTNAPTIIPTIPTPFGTTATHTISPPSFAFWRCGSLSTTNTVHYKSLRNGRRSRYHTLIYSLQRKHPPKHPSKHATSPTFFIVFLCSTTQRLCGSDSSPTAHLPSIRTTMEIQNPLSTRQNTVLVLYRTTGGPMPDSL